MNNDLEDIRKKLLTYIHHKKTRRTQEWSADIGIKTKDLIAFFMNLTATEETAKKIRDYVEKNS